MKLLIQTAVIAALGTIAMPAYAACEYPKKEEVPNGNVASKDEMIAGQKAVKAFMAEMEVYLDCLDKEAVEAAQANLDEAPDVTLQRTTLRDKRHNAAVEDMELYAAQFNEQVRTYKSRDK